MKPMDEIENMFDADYYGKKRKKQIKITPHKGGRTERVYARLTPEEKARLNKVLKTEDLSLSDWIVKQLNQQ